MSGYTEAWNPDPGTLEPTKTYQESVAVPDGGKPRYTALDLNPTTLLAPDFAEVSTGPSLSDLWNRFELAITPESQAEHIVNQIYGYDDKGIPLSPPNFVPEAPAFPNLPNVIAAPLQGLKNIVTKAGTSVQDFFVKYAIIGVALLVAAVFVYAFVGAKARKLA